MALVKGVEIGDNGTATTAESLKTQAQQNTQNAVTQSTDTATSTPLPTGMIGSQGKQIVNTPTAVPTQPVPETPTTAPVTAALGLPDPQYPDAQAPVIQPLDYNAGQTTGGTTGDLPNNTPYPSPSGADSVITTYNTGAKPATADNTGGTGGTGGSGSGGSGGGSGSTSTTSTSTSATGTGTTGTGTTAQAPAWKEYFDKANGMEFVYDPATDNAYKLAASQIEQQVTDMMVGRGGLYSSVTQSALTSRLMELQVSYQQQAYEKYVADRAYYMDVAAFVADREDTEFDQALELDKFKADLEQQKFENSITSAELAIQSANAAYSRQVSTAESEQQYTEGQLGIMQVDYDQNVSKYNELIARWKKNNVADYEIASYFGVGLGADYSSSLSKVNAVQSAISAQGTQLVSYAREVQNAAAYLNSIEAVKTGTSSTGTAATTSQVATAYNDNYTQVYNKVVSMHSGGSSWDSIKSEVVRKAADFRSTIGTINYNKLISYLDRKMKEE